MWETIVFTEQMDVKGCTWGYAKKTIRHDIVLYDAVDARLTPETSKPNGKLQNGHRRPKNTDSSWKIR